MIWMNKTNPGVESEYPRFHNMSVLSNCGKFQKIPTPASCSALFYYVLLHFLCTYFCTISIGWLCMDLHCSLSLELFLCNHSLLLCSVSLLVYLHHTLPNKCACLNKRAPTSDFHQPYLGQYLIDLNQIFKLEAKVFKSMGCQFH